MNSEPGPVGEEAELIEARPSWLFAPYAYEIMPSGYTRREEWIMQQIARLSDPTSAGEL